MLKFLKKSGKVLLIILSSLVGLVLLIAVALYLPPVQRIITGKATAFLEKKTQGKFDIGGIYLKFPLGISIRDIHVAGPEGDSILSAGKIAADLELLPLFSGSVKINSILLADLDGKVTRTDHDSSFNFSFIPEAFADTAKVPDVTDTTSSGAEITVSAIRIDNVKLLYDDRLTGMYAKANIHELDLDVKEMNLTDMVFHISELSLDKTDLAIRISKQAEQTEEDTTAALPSLVIDKIRITETRTAFSSLTDSTFMNVKIGELEVDDVSAGLTDMQFKVESILLAESGMTMNSRFSGTEIKDSSVTVASAPMKLLADIGKVTLKDNYFYRTVAGSPVVPSGSFNPSALRIHGLSGDINDLFYNGDSSRVVIDGLKFNDSTNFSLASLDASLMMNPRSVVINNFRMQTALSDIRIDGALSYTSMESLKDSIAEAAVNMHLDESKIHTNDIAYFVPAAVSSPQLKLKDKLIHLDADISGRVADLNVDAFSMKTGDHTSLNFTASLKGLPDASRLSYSVPDISFYTTRSDINSFVSSSALPQDINLPSAIVLNGNFNGSPAGLLTRMTLGTNMGGVTADMKMGFANDTSYQGRIIVAGLRLDQLLPKDSMLGIVSLTLDVDGKGLTREKIDAEFNLALKEAGYNNYVYHNANAKGNIRDQVFTGTVNMDDEYVAFDFDGLVSLKPDEEHYKFNLDLKGINLQKLNFDSRDIRISAAAEADLRGNRVDNINGSAGVSKLIIVKDENTYVLDSLLFASVNQEGKSEFNLRSAVVGIKFNGNFSPGLVAQAVKSQLNSYYDFGDTVKVVAGQEFTFEITLKNHPVIADVFLPGLTEFIPGKIEGSFNSDERKLNVDAGIKRIEYNGQTVNDFNLKLRTEDDQLKTDLNIGEVSASSFKMEQVLVSASLKENAGNMQVAIGEEDNRKLDIKAVLRPVKGKGNEISLQTPVILDKEEWSVPETNVIRLYENQPAGFESFIISQGNQQINIETTPGEVYITNFSFTEFDIIHFARIIEKDTTLASGLLTGYVELSQYPDYTGMQASVNLRNLHVMNTPVGELGMKAQSRQDNGYLFEMTLGGNGNDLIAKGEVAPADSGSRFDINADIRNINAAILDGLSMGAVSSSSGSIKGNIHLSGTSAKPILSGHLQFENLSTVPEAMNSKITLENERIEFNNDGISIRGFSIKDYENHNAELNGLIAMNGFAPQNLDLRLVTNDFRVFNTELEENNLYYGQLFMDADIRIAGTPSFPKVNASVKLEEGSTFAFVVPESKLSTDKGEGVVLFVDSLDLHRILREDRSDKADAGFKGIELTSRLEIDPEASLKVLIDPSTGDSLVVKGEAALSFSIDPSGKMSLTGLYELKDGSYVTSLQEVIQKEFRIVDGSTIVWNGDPLDATVNISAIYDIEASPIDLVAGQVAGLSDAERNQYKQKLDFLVYLQLRGQLLKPEISFRIELDEKDKGALGGTVDSKLDMLNEDPSELNKQVFALLLLNRFVQEDPLASGGASANTESIARSSVSRFLTDQLNNLAGRYITGAELKFDVESFEDYSSGDPQQRTQVGVALKKNFIDDRFSVQVGGSVDVEGEAAKQNNLADITGDVLIEYKITDDGRLRMTGFRKSEYQDAIEGQVTETGVGLLYNRDFDRWKEFFRKPEKIDSGK